MKKFAILIFVLLSIILIATGCNKNLLTNGVISEILGTDKLPNEELSVLYAFNLSVLENVIGDVDYVFVAYINSYLKTTYNEDFGDNFPTTYYEIEIIENIKGSLITNSKIELLKSGGISKKHTTFQIYSDDFLPKVHNYYIFCVYAQTNGNILASGTNSNIYLDNITNYKNSSQYLDVISAYQNQNATERERSKSKYDTN
ncbi:MAG: hypothetical protein LBF12_01815 [Christensenellaceae bacterium]|jgi:hypothetical protein|nr:hypothetical protein [Christensenellaceae bacterium]